MDTNEKFNAIKKTNDEYLAVIQSRDSSIEPNLNSQLYNDAQKRIDDFSKRHGSIDSATYNARRAYHMGQLFEAYKKELRGMGSSSRIHLNGPTDTNIDSVRRVIGAQAGNIPYNEEMYLDSDTIAALCHLASVSRNLNYDSTQQLVTYGALPKVIDEMIATKNIFISTSELGHLDVSKLTGSSIYNQTSIAERALENNISSVYFDKIQHSETALDFSNRKTNIFSIVAAKFKTFFENSHEPSRFGPTLGEQENKQKSSQEMGGR